MIKHSCAKMLGPGHRTTLSGSLFIFVKQERGQGSSSILNPFGIEPGGHNLKVKGGMLLSDFICHASACESALRPESTPGHLLGGPLYKGIIGPSWWLETVEVTLCEASILIGDCPVKYQ